MSIKVFLADDHDLLIAGFKNHLKTKNIDVVETANTLEGLSGKFKKSKAEVLIIDLRFNENQNGLEAAEHILQETPDAKIILLSQFDDEYIIEKTYRLGVLAFIRKDETESLISAIQSVAKGEEYLSPLIAKKLAIETIHSKNPTKLLTAQELKAFVLIADGYTPHELSQKMGVTYKTINTTIGSIREKLSIETYPEFTKIAIKYGLINLD